MPHNVIIIGSGPSGHTAAIYASRANLQPLMFEGFFAWGIAAGGQLTTTTAVENYPGFLEIQGPELMIKMREQSIKNGTQILTKTVDSVDLSSRPFKVISGNDTYEAHAIIVSTGATAKRMNVPGEEKLRQKGISACAVCDGGLPFFRNKVLVVVWWGDTACEEALYLTKFASKVIMLVRRDQMRASKTMQQRVTTNPKIEILWNTTLVEANGDQFLTGLTVARTQPDGSTQHQELDVGGLFYAIGHEPATKFLDGQIELDEAGYIKTHDGSFTSVEGVFAAGDVQDHVYRQAVTSAGTGCMAALDCERRLSEKWLTA